MARDYAKYKSASSQRKRVTQDWRGRLLLVFLLISLIIFGIYICKNNHFTTDKKNMLNWIIQTKSKFNHHQKIETELLVKKSVPKLNHQEPDVHFSFYTELPTMQVMLLK